MSHIDAAFTHEGKHWFFRGVAQGGRLGYDWEDVGRVQLRGHINAVLLRRRGIKHRHTGTIGPDTYAVSWVPPNQQYPIHNVVVPDTRAH